MAVDQVEVYFWEVVEAEEEEPPAEPPAEPTDLLRDTQDAIAEAMERVTQSFQPPSSSSGSRNRARIANEAATPIRASCLLHTCVFLLAATL